MLISSKNTLTDTPRIKFDQMSVHPLAHSSWHIKLAITQGKPILCVQHLWEPGEIVTCLSPWCDLIWNPWYVGQGTVQVCAGLWWCSKLSCREDPALELALPLTCLSLKHCVGLERKSPSFGFQSHLQLSKRDQLITTKPGKSPAISGSRFFHLYPISFTQFPGRRACGEGKEDARVPLAATCSQRSAQETIH